MKYYKLSIVLCILFLGCICDPAYLRDAKNLATSTTVTTTMTTIKVKKTITTTSTQVTLTTCKATQVKFLYTNLSRDISEYQNRAIKNLIPRNCFSACCSNGYFKCKYEVMDILQFPLPKFKESWSTGYYTQPDKDNEDKICLRINENNLSDFIEVVGEEWRVYEDDDSIFLERSYRSNLTKHLSLPLYKGKTTEHVKLSSDKWFISSNETRIIIRKI